MERNLRSLTKPIKIGSVLLKNRMVRSPMWSRMSNINGEVTQQLLGMYENAAKGGPAMIIVEATAVDGRYTWTEPQLRIDHRRFMPGLRRLVEAIHLNDAACEFQLHCAGAFSGAPISPSGVPCYGSGRASYVQPRALSLPEVEEIRELFISAAIRAKELECEGVVLHGATSYLLQQWVSPHTNKRTDRYGGSFENRIQLPLEIVRSIRQKCGYSFLIGYSMIVDELLPDGICLEEAKAFAKALQEEGVDHIDLMIGTYETNCLEKGVGRVSRQRRGLFEEAEIFKKLVTMKVFARSLGEHDPVRWEEGLEKVQCDVIQIGRPLLCDPELPKKVVEGRVEDIRLCIKCGQCFEALRKGYQHACSVNPGLGKEIEYTIKRITSAPKRVLVIGGGPGGLEAARVAALRGHEVTLIEKESELGGNARIASLLIGKEEIRTYFIDWLERQCRKAGVKLELNKEVSVKEVKELSPDVVIIATGSRPMTPNIPGIDKPHVVTAEAVLTKKAPVGGKVVVAGGGQVGVETAVFIVEQNLAKNITVIEMLPVVAYDMPAIVRTYMLEVLLPKLGLKAFTNMQIQEITNDGVVSLDKSWKKHRFEADTVINALGYVPNTTLSDTLKREAREVYKIGDCVKPRNILSAVHEGAYIGLQI